ncbi:MarR family transcriptional regulator [uncultured Maricaulis sp.]|uniref:MarR family winged helix-turn-helix transcriptional regulator n=1 Tax=uncultured Maricaulis sp. TaxID=174710 RepID=UPI0030D7DEC8|tara:strand:- start:8259 stop:8753 length:495 start_codon:yes stop_codon:yes gene_type:complete
MKKNNTPDRVDALISEWNREDPELRAEPMQVVGRIIGLGRAYQSDVTALLRPHGLSYSDFDVIATLRRCGRPYALTPTQLQQSVLLTSGAMTACLRRLELRGLICRQADAEDGRRSVAKLTSKGEGLVDRLIEPRFELAGAALAALDSRQIEALTTLLRKLERI